MIKLFTTNLQWKALSFGIALVLWMVVVGEPELVTSQSAPVFYKNLPRDLEIGSDVPDRVHLELRGPAGKLTAARTAELAILIDLSSVQSPGERTFTINPGSINLPTGVQFLRAVPSQLRLRFDRLSSKEVGVQVRTAGEAGLRIVREEIEPPRLKIVGPDNRVKQVDSAQTDPIDLSKVQKHAQFSVHAYVADPQVRFEGSPVVTVKIWVERASGNQ